MAQTLTQRMMELGVPFVMANELVKQMNAGVYNVTRLINAGWVEDLARYLAVSLPAGTFKATKAIEYSMIPAIVTLVAGAPPFNPASLYSGGAVGYLIDAAGVLYQDTAGATPAVVDGDKIGWALNQSSYSGQVKQGSTGPKPTLRIGGAFRWMEFDGVDDYLFDMIAPHYVAGQASYYFAIRAAPQDDRRLLAERNSSGSTGFYAPVQSGQAASSGSDDVTSFIRSDTNQIFLNQDASASVFDSGDIVLLVEDTGSAIRYYKDNVLLSERTYVRASGLAPNRFSLGAVLGSGVGSFFGMRLYAAMTITSILSPSDRVRLTTWMAAKQGRNI